MRLRLTALRAVFTICTMLPFIFACVGYTGYITLDGQGSPPARLTKEEIKRVSAAIEYSIEPPGMVEHPRLDSVRKVSRESSEIDFFVVREWVRGPSLGAGDDVRVFIKKDKRHGFVSVVIRNRTWPHRTEFTDALEEAVKNALSEALPQRGLTGQHRREGLFFW